MHPSTPDPTASTTGSRPRPVVIYGAVVAGLQALLGAGDLLNVIPDSVARWLQLTLVVLVAVGGALVVQAKVTPLSDPQDDRGVPLVAVDSMPASTETLAVRSPVPPSEPPTEPLPQREANFPPGFFERDQI